MKKLIGLAESLILLGIGLYMVYLSLSEAYILFLNPRYRWLTGTAGGGLCILALAGLWTRPNTVRPGRVLLFAVMAAIIAVFGQAPYINSSVNTDLIEQYEDPSPTLEHGGKTYTKINTGELYFLANEGADQEVFQDFAIRGQVGRTPELDQMGYFALLRVNFVCCAADATAMGILVAYPDVRNLEPGQWVRVLGHPEVLNNPEKLPLPPILNDAFYSTVSKKIVIQPDDVTPGYRPAKPYMFELSAEKPYNY